MIEGYGDGLFLPERNITRAEAVAVLLRQTNINIQNAPENSFFDVKNDAWYKDYIYTGVQTGLIEQQTSFVKPDEEISRAEFAKIAANLLKFRDCRELDTDNDTIPDFQETELGLDQTNPLDAFGDIDNDGLNNSDEISSNLDPRRSKFARRSNRSTPKIRKNT